MATDTPTADANPQEEALFNALLTESLGDIDKGLNATPAPSTAAVTDQTPEGRRAAIKAASEDPTIKPPTMDPTQAADMMATPTAETAGVSALSGIAKSFFETKDLLVGGSTDYEDKSDIRKGIESSQAARERLPGAAGVVNGLSRNIAQFTTAFVGLGKVPILGKAMVGATGKLGFALNTGRAAAVGAIAFDPHEERLANLVEQAPWLSTPITRYLAADINDSQMEGRLKSALESVGMDLVVALPFIYGLKAYKQRKAGDLKGAVKTEEEANKLMSSKAAERYFVNSEGDAMTDLATQDFKVAAQKQTDEARRQSLEQSFDGIEPQGVAQPGKKAEPQAGRPVVPGNELAADAAAAEGGLSPDFSVAPGGAPRGPSMAAESGIRDPSISGPVEGTTLVPGRSPTARAHEIVLPEIEVRPQNLERMRKDNAAIEEAGSMDEAIAGGHTFGGRNSLPWQKFTGPDEAAAWFGQTIEDNAARIEKARGGDKVGADGARIWTDKRQEALVDQWTRVFNEDPAMVLGALQRAGKEAQGMAARMEAAFLIANRANQDNYELALKVSLGNFGEFGSKDAALAALGHQMSIAVEMTAAARALLASAGRTVRRARGDFKARADAMAALDLQNMDKDALLTAILATKGDPALMNKLGQPGYFNLLVDFAGSLQAANLLWGWKTHVVNMVGNVAMTVWRPLEKGLGATAMKAAGKVLDKPALSAQGRTMATQARREVIALASVTKDGWEGAVHAFLRGDSKITPHQIEALSDQTTGAGRAGTGDLVTQWRPIKSMEDVVYNAMLAATTTTSLPLRAMGASDEMIRTMRYRAIVIAKASTDADDMGIQIGSPAYKAYIQKRVEDAFDANGAGVDAGAVAEAKASVFAQDLIGSGTQDTYGSRISIGAWMQNSASQIPLIRLVAPFIRTPTNLFRYGVKLTPGLNVLQKEYQNAIRGLKGPEEQARAIGQMMLGTMLVSQIIYLKSSGAVEITGSGPTAPKAAKEWRAEGNMPYSIAWKDKEGKRQYFQFNRLDPIQFPIAAVADYMEMREMAANRAAAGTQLGDEEDHWAQSILLAVSHQFRDKTYTKNIANFLQFLGDPAGREQLGYQMATGLLPMATLFRGVNQDEYLRETHSFLDTMKAGLPGYSDDLPPRYNTYGEKVKVPSGFRSEGRITGQLGDALHESYVETGGNVIQPMVPRDSATNVDYRDLRLEDGRTAYETLQQLSERPQKGMRTMRATLEKLVTTKPYLAAPHGRAEAQGTKEYMMSKVVSDYRRAAKTELQRTSKMFREKSAAEAKRNWEATLANRKNPSVEGSKAGLNALSPLMDAYGLGGILPGGQ